MKYTQLFAGLTALILIVSASTLFAVPPSDEVIQKLKDDGRYEDYLQTMSDARAKGVDAPTIDANGKARAPIAAASTVRALVILIDFPDKPFTSGYIAATQSDFSDLLFSEGVISTGSMREYYTENSFGQMTVEGDIAGWYTAANDAGYYTADCDGSHGFGSYPMNAQRLVEEAVALADPDVDFSLYDNDGDGRVDALFIVHAGTGYEESGSDCEIHSHAWAINTVFKDGVRISGYSMEPEESPSSGGIIPIGVFCHEFGHVLGLPDLYDTDYSSRGVGRWAVMSGGSYNNMSRTPAQFTAWSKYQLGWLTPINVTDNMTAVEFPVAAHNPVAYRLWTEGMYDNEYFLVENKQRMGYDANIPGEGLLIWHIDESRSGNTDEWHPLVMLEQADGDFDLQNDANSGDTGDPFPGATGARAFNDDSTPGSRDYNDAATMVAVWDISNSDSIMTANLDIHWSRPNMGLETFQFSDAAYGDGDGILEAGETVELTVALNNRWLDAFDVNLVLTADDPALTLTDDNAMILTIPAGGTNSNAADPFVIDIPVGYSPRIDSFFVQVSSNGGLYEDVISLEQNLGRTSTLIVDADNGDNLESYYTAPLYAEKTPFHRWDRLVSGSVSAMELNQYDIVIWYTGDYRTDPLTLSDVSAMQGFLDNGGNLFLTGQGIAAQLTTLAPDFLADYLRVNYTANNMVPLLLPSGGGQVMAGLDTLALMNYGSANNQTKPDHLTPINGAVAEIGYFISLDPAAISYAGSYKLIFFGFGFEGVSQDETRFEKRSTLFATILGFFNGTTPTYVAGDANADAATNVADAVYIINYAFKGGSAPDPMESGDVNGDCAVNVGDAVYLVNYIFREGGSPQYGCQ